MSNKMLTVLVFLSLVFQAFLYAKSNLHEQELGMIIHDLQIMEPMIMKHLQGVGST